MAQILLDHGRLARKVLIKSACGDGGLGREPLDTGGVDALLIEEPDGGVQNPLARPPAAAPGRRLHIRCHGHHRSIPLGLHRPGWRVASATKYTERYTWRGANR